MKENTELEVLRTRRYQHLQSHDWGQEEFTPDDRAGPKDHNPECPSCHGVKMVYAGESMVPWGELYYCPECRQGWRVKDHYWKNPANIRDGLSGDDLIPCPHYPAEGDDCGMRDSCILVKTMKPLGAPILCKTLPPGLIALVQRGFGNFGSEP